MFSYIENKKITYYHFESEREFLGEKSPSCKTLEYQSGKYMQNVEEFVCGESNSFSNGSDGNSSQTYLEKRRKYYSAFDE